jgi:hypothetical protein
MTEEQVERLVERRIDYLTWRERETAHEVIAQYRGVNRGAAMALVHERARDTRIRFKAYTAAHVAAAYLAQRLTTQGEG